jgi:zinc transport system ATP-binding protein
MKDTILKVKNLIVELDGEKIIYNLSFEVKEGDVVTILGPNGAGKTVLLRALLGILPYKGEIKWKEGIKVGYVPQRLPFIKDIPMSIEEFFKLKGAKDKEIKEILNSVGLSDDFLEKKINDLSSGQFQRILVAFALLKNPEVLLFDEPMTGIDISGQESIYKLLERLKKEKNLTILLVTHDLSVVFKFSNYVICLNKCPICQGIPKEILTLESLQKLYGEELRFYQHYHQH